MAWIAHIRPACLAVLSAFVSGCMTPAPPPITPVGEGVVTVPYRVFKQGLIGIEVMVNGQGPFTFMLDTGATQSFVFEPLIEKMGLSEEVLGRPVRVSGMVSSDRRPTIEIDHLSVAETVWPEINAIVLEGERAAPEIDGGVGMDVLSAYSLIVNETEGMVSFAPPERFRPEAYDGWNAVTLTESPYPGREFGLHYAKMRVGMTPVPMMIDTGATFSSMNWRAADQNLGIRQMRRRLHRQTGVQGAVGEYRPRVAVNLRDVRLGEAHWDTAAFVLLPLDSLSSLSADREPFGIAGVNLFERRSFAIDFAQDRLYISDPPGAASDPVDDE